MLARGATRHAAVMRSRSTRARERVPTVLDAGARQ